MLECVRRIVSVDKQRRVEEWVERADEAAESWDGQEKRDGGVALIAALSNETGVGWCEGIEAGVVPEQCESSDGAVGVCGGE